MLRWVAILALAVVELLATAAWYGEQRYKDCLYAAIGSTQADNTGASATTGLEQVSRIKCSRSPF
jgi:hypothetical protein